MRRGCPTPARPRCALVVTSHVAESAGTSGRATSPNAVLARTSDSERRDARFGPRCARRGEVVAEAAPITDWNGIAAAPIGAARNLALRRNTGRQRAPRLRRREGFAPCGNHEGQIPSDGGTSFRRYATFCARRRERLTPTRRRNIGETLRDKFRRRTRWSQFGRALLVVFRRNAVSSPMQPHNLNCGRIAHASTTRPP
jgi:hypothetical protein